MGVGVASGASKKIFHTPLEGVFFPRNTPLEGVFFAYEHPLGCFVLPFNTVQGPINFLGKSWKNAKHRRNRTRGMRARILNPRGPPALFENRNELKLIRNIDSAYVNILVIA